VIALSKQSPFKIRVYYFYQMEQLSRTKSQRRIHEFCKHHGITEKLIFRVINDATFINDKQCDPLTAQAVDNLKDIFIRKEKYILG
jgi:hypothetical protein